MAARSKVVDCPELFARIYECNKCPSGCILNNLTVLTCGHVLCNACFTSFVLKAGAPLRYCPITIKDGEKTRECGADQFPATSQRSVPLPSAPVECVPCPTPATALGASTFLDVYMGGALIAGTEPSEEERTRVAERTEAGLRERAEARWSSKSLPKGLLGALFNPFASRAGPAGSPRDWPLRTELAEGTTPSWFLRAHAAASQRTGNTLVQGLVAEQLDVLELTGHFRVCPDAFAALRIGWEHFRDLRGNTPELWNPAKCPFFPLDWSMALGRIPRPLVVDYVPTPAQIVANRNTALDLASVGIFWWDIKKRAEAEGTWTYQQVLHLVRTVWTGGEDDWICLKVNAGDQLSNLCESLQVRVPEDAHALRLPTERYAVESRYPWIMTKVQKDRYLQALDEEDTRAREEALRAQREAQAAEHERQRRALLQREQEEQAQEERRRRRRDAAQAQMQSRAAAAAAGSGMKQTEKRVQFETPPAPQEESVEQKTEAIDPPAVSIEEVAPSIPQAQQQQPPPVVVQIPTQPSANGRRK